MGKRPLAFSSLFSRWVAVFACGPALFAVDADKSRFNLFNPTPAGLMREMRTDRPDKTESPFTVDAGHFQAELDIVNYTYDRFNGIPGDVRTEAVGIGPINLKVGILNNADLQLVIQTYHSVRVHNFTTRQVIENRGFGDILPRLKLNIWGDDGGRSAFALMPFLKLPTNDDGIGNSSVEGGLILPLSLSLPYGFDMGVMTEVDFLRDSFGPGRHSEFVNSITFSHDLVGELSGFLEFFSSVSTESRSEWVGTLDVGLAYLLIKNVQLDAGAFFGVTRSAEDINPFLGISWRF